jgi:hypothetical protein
MKTSALRNFFNKPIRDVRLSDRVAIRNITSNNSRGSIENGNGLYWMTAISCLISTLAATTMIQITTEDSNSSHTQPFKKQTCNSRHLDYYGNPVQFYMITRLDPKQDPAHFCDIDTTDEILAQDTTMLVGPYKDRIVFLRDTMLHLDNDGQVQFGTPAFDTILYSGEHIRGGLLVNFDRGFFIGQAKGPTILIGQP